MKTKQKKRKKNSTHVPVPGVDPSTADMEFARQLQSIKPPQCLCFAASRLKKVKRSKYGGDSSRAIGKYFFFCGKARDDDGKCGFARPIEEEIAKRKLMVCAVFVKMGSCPKGDACVFRHDNVPDIAGGAVDPTKPKQEEGSTNDESEKDSTEEKEKEDASSKRKSNGSDSGSSGSDSSSDSSDDDGDDDSDSDSD